MIYALTPICKYEKGIMFAECDSKLFKTVNILGLKAIALNKGIEYLGSVTIPMYATRDGMIDFFIQNYSLALKMGDSPGNTGKQNSSSYFNGKSSV